MKLSVVVPACNEEENLPVLHVRLERVATACADDHEFIFIDDGSHDRTLDVLRDLAARDPRVRYLSFSRNFGHEAASTAGLDRADGDTVVLMDADLQDPPELIPRMLQQWRAGAHVVYAQRRARPGEPILRRASAFLFYRLLSLLTDVTIPPDTGDFRLMDRKVVLAFRRCRENPRFVRGLISWVGFTQVALPYDRGPRHAGRSKYGFRKLVGLSVEALTAFSLKPLRLMMWAGLALAVLGLGLTIPLTLALLWAGSAPPLALAFLACGILGIGSMQLLLLGVMANYVCHNFRRGQNRPMYIIAEESAAPDAQPEIVVTASGAVTA